MAYKKSNANGQAAMADSEPVVIANDQSAVPISGTVTANLSATDNAVLDAIEVDTTTLAGAVSGTEMQVDVVTSALPTGAATSAKQDTGNTSLSSIDGKITAVNTGAVVVASGSITANAGT